MHRLLTVMRLVPRVSDQARRPWCLVHTSNELASEDRRCAQTQRFEGLADIADPEACHGGYLEVEPDVRGNLKHCSRLRPPNGHGITEFVATWGVCRPHQYRVGARFRKALRLPAGDSWPSY